MMKRTAILRAALTAAVLTAGAAHAEGQATFYSWQNFGGQDLTVADSKSNFTGFPAPESALIRTGNWEICTRPDFLGRCTVIPPGEYPRIGEQFGHIASAREVGTIPEGERDYRRYWNQRERRGWR